MAIDGIIILDNTGRPIIQSGFRSKSPAYPLLHIDALNNEIQKDSNIDPVLYVQTTDSASACCHLAHSDVYILCPVSGDVDPLLAFAFIQTFINILTDYFGSVSAGVIKDNFDVVYQLFEETLDTGGHPLTTHSNALRDIVIPPSLLNKLLSTVAGPNISSISSLNNPSPGTGPFSSPIPWRKAGVKHANNEAYFDMVELLRAVVNKHGTTVTCLVTGRIEANSKLSGTPDCLLSFTNPNVLADIAFHPCVRYKRWTREKVLSFVPPDGRFTLVDYRYSNVAKGGKETVAAVTSANANVQIPFIVKPVVDLDSSGGTFHITFQSRISTHTFDKVLIQMNLGQGASGVKCVVSRGSGGRSGGFGNVAAGGVGEAMASWAFDSRKGTLKWEIRSVLPSTSWSMQGSFSTPHTPRPSRSLRIQFDIHAHTFSALRVDQLKILGESYKPFKGVRGRSGVDVEWRW
ncbi:clathrin adaptor mu subunit [Marasmius fiardii PR-910]|nr:clathrin adaptor mu subunit [Marasmius fiardii PR-910]